MNALALLALGVVIGVSIVVLAVTYADDGIDDIVIYETDPEPKGVSNA